MDTVFKYNRNGNYSNKYLKGEYTGNNFLVSLLDVYLNEKGPSAQIRLLNIFKAYHYISNSGPT